MNIKYIIIIILTLALGFFLIYTIGGSLITEVTQEVRLEARVEAAAGGRVGKYVPDWTLPTLTGEEVNLIDFLGTPLVLTFWTTWNPASADQIKIFDDYLSRNGKGLFKIVTVSSQEDRSAVLNFMRRGGYKVTVLVDESGEVGRATARGTFRPLFS